MKGATMIQSEADGRRRIFLGRWVSLSLRVETRDYGEYGWNREIHQGLDAASGNHPRDHILSDPVLCQSFGAIHRAGILAVRQGCPAGFHGHDAVPPVQHDLPARPPIPEMAFPCACVPDRDIRPAHLAGRHHAGRRPQNTRRMRHALPHLPYGGSGGSDYRQAGRKSF